MTTKFKKQMPRQVQNQFMYAAENAQYNVLQEILDCYGNTDARDFHGNTPLIVAARNGNTRTVSVLLNAGANIHACNKDLENALILASREAHTRVVRLLLEHGATCEHKPLGNRRALVRLKPVENSIFITQNVNSTTDPTWEPWSSIKKPSALRVKRTGRLLCKVVELLIESGAEINSLDDNNDTPLLNFIQCGDMDDSAQLLLNNHAAVNITNNDGQTALTEAIMQGKEDIAIVLLESGADPNAGDSVKPIHQVAGSSLSPDFLRKLIAAGADVNIKDDGKTALFMTLRRWRDNQEITQILLDAGADTEVEDGHGFTILDHAMIAALEREDAQKYSELPYPDDFIPYQFPFNPGYARFVRAAKDGDYDALQSQLENQMPGKIKTLALIEAIWQDKIECCQVLLEHGADHNSIGFDSYPALALAAAELHVEIARLLHSYGADLELGNGGGQKPLYLACQAGCSPFKGEMPPQKRLQMVALLLGRGAEVEGADKEGWTPLRQALLATMDIDLVCLLLEHGAMADKRDNYGTTPLQLAERHCSSKMLELLRESMER